MALKPARKYDEGTDISFFMNEVGEKGTAVVFCPGSAGVGAAMDDPNATVCLSDGTAGEVVVGLLTTDVVDIDESRCCRNWHRDETTVCGKVTVMTHGWAVTNMVDAGVTPAPGEPAYAAANGLWSNVDGGTGNAPAGRFMSAPDADGYVKIAVNILV